jgi:hypothetical protein
MENDLPRKNTGAQQLGLNPKLSAFYMPAVCAQAEWPAIPVTLQKN